jgi:uncharacterized membrane protein
MAVNKVGLPGMPVNEALLWARLPLQFVMAAWVWWVALRDAIPAERGEDAGR